VSVLYERHDLPPLTVADLAQWTAAHSPTQFANLSRRELACLRARYSLWRQELAERVQRQIAENPTTPVNSNQQLIRYCDGRLDELRIELERLAVRR
jgi:hypothetical protein